MPSQGQTVFYFAAFLTSDLYRAQGALRALSRFLLQQKYSLIDREQHIKMSI